MPDGETLQRAVAHYVGVRRRAVEGLLFPAAQATATTFLVAVADSIIQQWVSPVFVLSTLFAVASLLSATSDIDITSLDHAFAWWRLFMAVVMLGWICVMYYVIGYHTPLHDLGCMFCAGSFLCLLVARNAWEATGYLVAHFLCNLGADVPSYTETMFVLVALDLFMIYATWAKGISIDTLEHLTSLSMDISTISFGAVRNALLYLCDATVVVDRDLRLQEDALDLGTLLARKCGEGRSLRDFTLPADIEKFASDLTERFALLESSGQPELSSIQVRMSDAYSSPVSFHVFVAAVATQKEDFTQSRFLLGISEQWHRRKKDSETKTPSIAPTKLRFQTGLFEPPSAAKPRSSKHLAKDVKSQSTLKSDPDVSARASS